MNNFTLNTKTDNLFLIGLSEIQQRLDAEFYLEDFDFTDFIKLRNIAKVKGGKRLPKGFYYSEAETDYLYLQVSNLDSDNEINWQTAKYISKEVFEILERYETVEGDLVFSIAGSIGKINVVKNIPEGKKVILTENASKIHFKKDVQVIPEFIELVLKTPLLQKQINLNYIQTTIPKIGLDRIENLFIPELPSIEKQKECLDYFKSAFESKQQKNKEAKELLSSIDNYLLVELGIVLPEKDNTLRKRIFTSSLSEVSGGRFDPFYFFNCIKVPVSSKFEEAELKDLTIIVKGQSITSSEIKDGEYPVIAGGQSSPYSHNVFNHKGNVITISASGAYSGFVWFHKNPIFASDCSVLYSKNEAVLNTEFLANVLKLKQQQLYNLQQGSGQPHVYPSDIKKIKIPLPPIEKQLELNKSISEKKVKAKQLEVDAKEVLNQAKLEVEKIILG